MARSPNGSIVTFRHRDQVVGVGFLVGKRHILTCAHVVNAVLGRDLHAQDQPADDVEIVAEFTLVDHHPTRRATVVRWVPPAVHGAAPTRACDIAGLELLSTETLPRGSTGRKLVKPRAHADVEVYGYPADPPRANGNWSHGQLLREVDNGFVQIDTALSAAIRAQPGYSGSPVIDTRSGRAAGMLTSASTRDGQRDSYAVTSTRLHKLWPEAVRVTWAIPRPRWTPRTRLFARLGVGALVVVLLAWLVPPWLASEPGDCTPLEISVSTEKDELLEELARDYNNREHDGPCAQVSVAGLTSGTAMTAIARGWPAEIVERRPVPQVWLPSTSMWADLLRQCGQAKVLGEELSSVTTSVLAVAMPRGMAQAARDEYGELSWAEFRELAGPDGGWDAIGHGDLGPFTLGRDNPNFSSSGLAASVATYYGATGKQGGITEADLLDGDNTQFVRDIETSVLRYGEEATTFMQTLYQEDQAKKEPSISAVLVQEQLVHLYNRGVPTGELSEAEPPPNEPLVAVQPEDGTVEFDHPFVVLASASDDQRAAAADFHEFLVADAQQQRFVEQGFRAIDQPDRPTPLLADSVGVPSDSAQTFFEPPAPELIKAMRDAWAGTRRPARVLLVLDMSRSMNDPADPRNASGQTKLDLLRPAAKQGLALLGAKDEVGIWTFAGTVDTRLPLSPVSEVRDQLDGIIDDLPVAPNTALHAAVSDTHDAMLATIDQLKINAIVVLSDGRQIPPDPAGEAPLLRKIDPTNLETSVRVFTVPYGSDADKELLDDIAETSKAVSYDATNPDSIEEVMVSVFSNFGYEPRTADPCG
ncbi:substrate-binding domain-containing protein [Actinophytocola sediminis]